MPRRSAPHHMPSDGWMGQMDGADLTAGQRDNSLQSVYLLSTVVLSLSVVYACPLSVPLLTLMSPVPGK